MLFFVTIFHFGLFLWKLHLFYKHMNEPWSFLRELKFIQHLRWWTWHSFCWVITFSSRLVDSQCFEGTCRLLDVRGCGHHSIIHTENPTRCNSVSKYYFIFIWSSTCFGRHTAHHQEPKTALTASGFAYVEGCWTCSCWTLTAWWWAECRPKHVELRINIKQNFDTLLHLVGFFMWIVPPSSSGFRESLTLDKA